MRLSQAEELGKEAPQHQRSTGGVREHEPLWRAPGRRHVAAERDWSRAAVRPAPDRVLGEECAGLRRPLQSVGQPGPCERAAQDSEHGRGAGLCRLRDRGGLLAAEAVPPGPARPAPHFTPLHALHHCRCHRRRGSAVAVPWLPRGHPPRAQQRPPPLPPRLPHKGRSQPGGEQDDLPQRRHCVRTPLPRVQGRLRPRRRASPRKLDHRCRPHTHREAGRHFRGRHLRIAHGPRAECVQSAGRRR
mmetsp:Transcript_18858/g.72687  ORF Transcript_18858/g.72687 Transcript_18858/m.72687 type:complete len:245 (+) Transcript_18858:837-1571(+)